MGQVGDRKEIAKEMMWFRIPEDMKFGQSDGTKDLVDIANKELIEWIKEGKENKAVKDFIQSRKGDEE